MVTHVHAVDTWLSIFPRVQGYIIGSLPEAVGFWADLLAGKDIQMSFCLGLSELMSATQSDYSKVPIRSLCSIESGILQFEYFKQACPLLDMVQKFHLLYHDYRSGLFLSVWNLQLEETSSADIPVTFEGVVDTVCKPVFCECCQLVDSMKTESITFTKVDLYFTPLKDCDVKNHLRNLYHAVEECRGNRVLEFSWIRTSIEHMERYWDLCEQAGAAKIVLKLREELKLSGDFVIFENVASSVPTGASLISMCHENLEDTISFLKQFADRDKKRCLENFASCLRIVDWIRGETTGAVIIHAASSALDHLHASGIHNTKFSEVQMFGVVA